MNSQTFCLKWDAFQNSITSSFDLLRQDEELVDITLCCDGQSLKAHRLMLSACSPYFRELLKNNQCQHMVIFLKDTSVADLQAVIEFVYKGRVNVAQSQLASFIKTAEMLQIRGLSGEDDKTCPAMSEDWPPDPGSCSPPVKRRRRRSASPAAVPGPSPSPAGADRCRPSESTLLYGQPDPGAACSASAAPPPPEPVKIEKIDLSDTDGEEEGGAPLDNRLAGLPGTGAGLDGIPGSAAGLSGIPGSGAGLAEVDGDGTGFGGDLDGVAELPLPAGVMDDPAVDWRRVRDPAATQDSGGAVHRCPICCRGYSNARSLEYHKKMHAGLTTCALCGKVTSKVEHLRRHLEHVHKLTQQDIRSIVPTRDKARPPARLV
ncbi:protein bric-a-brac 2-like isoform X2 [Amphibalanus amphitrite]|nr:protein bric-a-brac 2-like isoform X2 [Amphibalanus amphitrite]